MTIKRAMKSRSAFLLYYINVDDVEPLRGYIDHKKAKVGENVIPIKKKLYLTR